MDLFRIIRFQSASASLEHSSNSARQAFSGYARSRPKVGDLTTVNCGDTVITITLHLTITRLFMWTGSRLKPTADGVMPVYQAKPNGNMLHAAQMDVLTLGAMKLTKPALTITAKIPALYTATKPAKAHLAYIIW